MLGVQLFVLSMSGWFLRREPEGLNKSRPKTDQEPK